MLLVERPRQHDDLACAARRQRKPSLRRPHAGQCSKHSAKPADFDSQARAMRFIGGLRAECASNENVPRHVSSPRFAQRASEREQHRTACERDHRACMTHDMTARVDDERVRCQKRLHFLEQQESFLAARNQARRGRSQDEGCVFDLRRQCGDTRSTRGVLGPSESGTRHLRPQAADRNPGNHELVGGP